MGSSCRRLLVVLALALSGCTEGEDGSADGSSYSGPTAATMTTGGSTSAPTTDAASGGSGDADDTTGDAPPTTGDDTTTTNTTGDDTTTTGVDDTGPICDPGQPSCVCDGDTCVDGYACVDGVCTAAMICDGDAEPPGESEMTPTPLDDVTDDDDEFHQIPGVLGGARDTDWYRYLGTDTLGHFAEPTIEVLSASAGMRVCQFIECVEGGPAQTDLTCPEGTQFAISPMLRPGCCHTTGFTIGDFGCSGDEDMQVYVRLDMPATDTCVDYEIKLHY